ncbi:cytochrome c-type biogenesis protein CcmH [Hoeflea sp. WL0058]|uniref:Cytochrome c-type biogenesis protein n=1 Tax=Flavimaribacter sediminis TaxID=2865987 RepID=A0AAE2ZM64_9HYPH|nr:cytochrome c-type biogenesis protein [Flavimaribacter sediminis]MBW8639454.1 cytochrome c-type biogenesis protein CcmH [Flavimaribacter sediminis]
MTTLVRQALLVLLLLIGSAGQAFAVTPDEMLDDPALEQRARAISAGLRCLVCQNQSIDDSDAELAHDLRVLVRQRLVEGDSDEEVINYVVSRYGEFVLLRPRLTAQTIALWSTPAILLAIGLIWLVASIRRRAATASGALLSDDEKRELDRLLDAEKFE